MKAAAAAPRGPAPMPLPLGGAARAAGAEGRASCIRCRQGFFCADHPAEPSAPLEPPKPTVRRRGCARGAGLAQPRVARWLTRVCRALRLPVRSRPSRRRTPTRCRRAATRAAATRRAPGCRPRGRATLTRCPKRRSVTQFTERANADDACRFHPGPPIFHERQKGWQCCNKARRRRLASALRWRADAELRCVRRLCTTLTSS